MICAFVATSISGCGVRTECRVVSHTTRHAVVFNERVHLLVKRILKFINI